MDSKTLVKEIIASLVYTDKKFSNIASAKSLYWQVGVSFVTDVHVILLIADKNIYEARGLISSWACSGKMYK